MKMVGTLNILILNTVLLFFHLTDSQPSSLNLTQTTRQERCSIGKGSLVRLNRLNNSELQTEFLIRPMWSTVGGNYTPWIAYKGCFDIGLLTPTLVLYFKKDTSVEECYIECQRENIRCGQNEPIYFLIKELECHCVCKIQGILSQSNKCNESCSSGGNCRTDRNFKVYTEYAMEYKGSKGFCLICTEANLNYIAKLDGFACNGEPFAQCVKLENICYGMKENNSNKNFSNTDCGQLLPYICLKDNEMITSYNVSKVTSTTVDQSSEDITIYEVHSSEDTSTLLVQSSKLSFKHPFEVKSSIPLPNSSSTVHNKTMLSTDTVGAIVGLFVAVFSMAFLVFFLWFYRNKQNHKLRDFQNELIQQETSQTINNAYTDMMLVSGANRNDVVFRTSTNDVQNDVLYVENEEGEYDHLHSSRPKQDVSESEDERYATSTQLEDVTYSTVRKSRKSVPDCDDEYESIAASLGNNC